MDNSDRLTLALFGALVRLVPQDDDQETAVRCTFRNAAGDFVGEVKIPENVARAVQEALTSLGDFAADAADGDGDGPADSPYAHIVDEYSFPDPDLEAAVEAVFAEPEQTELGNWDREVMEAAVSGQPGALRDLLPKVLDASDGPDAPHAPEDDDDLPLPDVAAVDNADWVGKGHITLDRTDSAGEQ
ncbi:MULTISPECIES: hypothetical protein [unclassified Streptomyces]|uniref:hypothetical protein n=1 Tax=unclassified Streptomyces TaxID=2593676 RepID=UPI0033EF4AE3